MATLRPLSLIHLIHPELPSQEPKSKGWATAVLDAIRRLAPRIRLAECSRLCRSVQPHKPPRGHRRAHKLPVVTVRPQCDKGRGPEGIVGEGSSQAVGRFREGDVVAGKYRIGRVLGAGGMGVVVAAHHIQLDEKVALKFLFPEALSSPEAVARFIREARAAVRIKSENVVRVSDVGSLENGAPYIVMEYLEGGDLAGWLRQRGALPIEQGVDFVLQACVGIAEAHSVGIVHRDLKPANLFCVRRSDGQLGIKVLDFGISKVTSRTGSGPSDALTNTSSMMGTPLYMSPEQLRSSKDVDTRTDIWALGAILFELVAGKAAFLSESVTELAIKIANDPPPPLRDFRPDAPPELQAVMLRCLEKDRERRFRNVAELALALLPFAPRRAKAVVERVSGIIQAGGLSESALEVPASPPAEATAASPGTLPPVGRTTTGTPVRKTAGLGIAVALALGLFAVGGMLALRSLRGPLISTANTAVATSPPAAPALPVASQVRLVPTAESVVSLATSTSSAPPVFPPVASVNPHPLPSPVMPPPHPVGGAAGSSKAAAPAPPPGATSASTTAPAPVPNCNPPYTIDSAGHRHYKPECP